MGYRSEVAIGMAFKSDEDMIGLISKKRLLGGKNNKELDFYKVYTYDSSIVILTAYFDDVKWYEEFDDVKWHENFVDEAHELGASTIIMRIGEDTIDITEDWQHSDEDGLDDALYDSFYIHRGISSPHFTSTQVNDDLYSIKDFVNKEG